MDMERFNLKQLNEEEVKEQYQVTIKNKFAALENLDDNGDINRAWETIRENIRISAKDSLIKGSRLNYSGCKTLVK
jgi:hypothetical protein